VNPLLYSLIGLIAGAGTGALIFALARRGRKEDSELVKRFELLERAQERGERLAGGNWMPELIEIAGGRSLFASPANIGPGSTGRWIQDCANDPRPEPAHRKFPAAALRRG